MKNTLPRGVVEELRSYIDRDVAAGFLPAAEIIESVVEVLSDEADPQALRHEAVKATAEALRAHALAQSQWPAVTDCDRLDSAFAALETLGIIARQNFSCCGTCGAGEILDEMAAAATQGQKAYGYTFYHAQDSESAAEGYGLCLNYGTEQDDEEAALAVAQKVVGVLEAHGLATEWDGTFSKRIAVTLDWQRRRTDGATA